MSNIQTAHPTECILWKTRNPSIDQVREAFECLKTFEEESHLTRRMLRCKECGHVYFYEFYEEVDWSEGKDAQYITWIPVDDVESAQELSKLSSYEILSFPSIRYDYPKGADQATGPYWNCPRNSVE